MPAQPHDRFADFVGKRGEREFTASEPGVWFFLQMWLLRSGVFGS